MLSPAYFSALSRILAEISERQAEPIARAADLVSRAIASGRVVQAFGSGHSHMIAEEAFFRAGGLVPVNLILDESLIFLNGAVESTRAERQLGYAATILAREDIRAGDVGIVISNSGRNAVPIEMALHLQAAGVKVIAITNPRQAATSPSRHESGQYLYQVADVVIDNCVPVGDAVFEVPGLAQKMGPSSTVAGAAIVNAIMIEAAARLEAMGEKVPVIASANVGIGALSDIEATHSAWTSRVRLFAKDSF